MRFLSLLVVHQTIDTRFSKLNSLTAHRKSCIEATNRFRCFDFMFRKVENSCAHSHVDGNISNCETAREASVGYDAATSSQKLIAGRPLCLIFASLSSCKSINSFYSPVPTAKLCGVTKKRFFMCS